MLCTLAGPLLACSFARSSVQLNFAWFLGTQSPNPPLGPTLSSPAPSGIFSVLCVQERASHMQPSFSRLTPSRTACGVCLTAEKILLSAALGKERSEAEAQIVFAAGGAVARGGRNHCTQRGKRAARSFREVVVFLRWDLV